MSQYKTAYHCKIEQDATTSTVLKYNFSYKSHKYIMAYAYAFNNVFQVVREFIYLYIYLLIDNFYHKFNN